jgi:hypothetical protein
MTSEQEIQAILTGNRILGIRRTAKALLGDRYEAKVEPWRQLVRGLAAEWKCRALEVPLKLSEAGELPEQPLMLFAAVADVAGERAPIMRPEDGRTTGSFPTLMGFPVVVDPEAKGDVRVVDQDGKVVGRMLLDHSGDRPAGGGA